ncbi:MAG TPA: acyltransferase [Rhizomicrobium sp.]|jgi:peptidoglycan/LPS O-acetylase OafA/YrhL|nr:acyltransferase [Rhizomicrobium sp.]
MTTKRFLGLDGLRGVCALTILFFHCANFFHKGPIFLHGFLAVDMFFILSGFVISLTYEEKLRGGYCFREFLFNRGRRLFPTYWLGAAINIVLFIAMATTGYIASNDAPWMIWIFIPLTTLLLIPDYITPDGLIYPAMDSVAWSLFAEWTAYFAYAFGAFRWKTSALLLVALSGWGTMAFIGLHSGAGWAGGGDRATLLTIGVLRCLPAFAAGVVIYRVHRHPLFGRLPVIATEILLALWLVAAVLPRPVATPLLDDFIVIVISPLLVCLLVRSEHKAPAFCKTLGEISYPLYVVHPGLIVLATYTPVFGLWRGPHPASAALVVALCLLLAWLVHLAVGRLQLRARNAGPRPRPAVRGPIRAAEIREPGSEPVPTS